MISDAMVVDLNREADYQYAVIEGARLEHYTATGWDYVRLIEVAGVENMMRLDVFEHAAASNGYSPPPIQYAGQSGNPVRWSAVAVLVRRARKLVDAEEVIANLNTRIIENDRIRATLGDNVMMLDKLLADEKCRVTEFVDKLREKEVALGIARNELNAAKKVVETVELDVGKREMDRILGRFPDPSTIDLTKP